METVHRLHTELHWAWEMNPEPSAPPCSPATSDANNCPGKKGPFCESVIYQGFGRLCENMWTFLLNTPDHPCDDTPFTALFTFLDNSSCFCLEFLSKHTFIACWTVSLRPHALFKNLCSSVAESFYSVITVSALISALSSPLGPWASYICCCF